MGILFLEIVKIDCDKWFFFRFYQIMTVFDDDKQRTHVTFHTTTLTDTMIMNF